MSNKELTSVLLSGLAVTGGVLATVSTGGTAPVAGLIFTGALAALGGIGGNLLSSYLEKKFINPSSKDEILRNGDLIRAVGKAIFILINDEAKKEKYGSFRAIIKHVGEGDGKEWEAYLEERLQEWEKYVKENIDKEIPSVEAKRPIYTTLEKILPAQLTKYIKAGEGEIDKLQALTPESWAIIVKGLFQLRAYQPEDEVCEEIGKRLHQDFPKALRKVLIDDFSQGGRAYASMVFRLLSEAGYYSKKNYEDNQEIKQKLDALIIRIDQVDALHSSKEIILDNKFWQDAFDLQKDINVTTLETLQRVTRIELTLQEHTKKLDRIFQLLISLLENQAKQTRQKLANHKVKKLEGLINISADRKSLFTEQGSVLEDLETQLKNKHIACLHGKHGLGKTTNAQEFARRQIGNYEFIVFLNAAEKIIETSIIEFADRYVPELQELPLVDRERVQHETKLKLFKSFLEDNQPQQDGKRAWLLIFDNLEKRDHIRAYFPKRNHGDILYTCNDDLWIDERCEVPIREFSQEEAELFLYKTKAERRDASREDIPPETLADIQKILSEYGRLPFVLSKFRNYLSEVRISYAAFFDELKNNEQRYLEAFASSVDYQHKNEVIAFSVSFEKVADFDAGIRDDELINRLAIALLNISAFCFADQIPEELLKETLFRKVDTSETTVSQEVLFAEAFRKLERFDLLNARTEIFDYLEKKAILDEGGNQVTVEYIPIKKEETVYESHRIIQKIVKLKLEKEVKIEILNEIIFVLRSFIPYPHLENWKIYEKHLSNTENIIQESGNLKLATEILGFICNQFGYYQAELAQFEKAIEKFKEALQIDEKTIGKEHPRYATRLNNLGEVYRLQGRYDEAIEKFKEALRITEKTIGKEHPNYAIRLSNLATVYADQGRYDEAIEKFEEALRITEKTIGKEHPDYATRLNNLASVYFNQEKYQNALDLYEEALRIFEKTLPENHPHTIQLREGVARCRRILGK